MTSTPAPGASTTPPPTPPPAAAATGQKTWKGVGVTLLPVPFQCPGAPFLLPAFCKPLPEPPVTIWALPAPQCPYGPSGHRTHWLWGLRCHPPVPQNIPVFPRICGCAVNPPDLGTDSPWVPRCVCDPPTLGRALWGRGVATAPPHFSTGSLYRANPASSPTPASRSPTSAPPAPHRYGQLSGLVVFFPFLSRQPQLTVH